MMNNAALNIHVQVLVGTCIFSSAGYTPRGGIAGSHGNCQTSLQSGWAREKVSKAEGTASAKACL